MPRFLIDVNLPYRLDLWREHDCTYVYDINERWKDTQIWSHARTNDLVIVSKDSDFSDLAMTRHPPPRVVHVRLGNMRVAELEAGLRRWWPWVVANIERCRLVRIYADRLEAVEEDLP